MKILYLSCLIIALNFNFCFGKIDSDTQERITSSLDAVITVADKIKDHKDALKDARKAVGPLISSIGKFEPLLGASGAFLSVIFSFLPQGDSKELTYMKEKFAEVNNKLDKITDKFEDVATLIEHENQRTAYITREHEINFGYDKLNEFYNEAEKLNAQVKSNVRDLG